MKNLIGTICLLVFVVSCKKTEVTDIVLQAKINDSFFRAIDARVTENEDGTYLIQGITQRESITMKIENLELGTYNFGEMSENYASFEKANGDSYFSNPNGQGNVRISNYNANTGTASGSFEFLAMQEGVDTIAVQNGLFYQARVISFLDDDVIVDPVNTAGTFICLIEENPYNPFNVSALASLDMIEIKGFTLSKSITIKIPLNIDTGDYPIPSEGFSASYEDTNGVQDANSGNVIVFSHDTVERKIKGTFFFLTDLKAITLGQFNVTYQ
jgi:hypothetical protein